MKTKGCQGFSERLLKTRVECTLIKKPRKSSQENREWNSLLHRNWGNYNQVETKETPFVIEGRFGYSLLTKRKLFSYYFEADVASSVAGVTLYVDYIVTS